MQLIQYSVKKNRTYKIYEGLFFVVEGSFAENVRKSTVFQFSKTALCLIYIFRFRNAAFLVC